MGLLDFDPQKNPLIGKLPLPGVPMGMPAPKPQAAPTIPTPSQVAPKVAPVNLPPVSPTTQADMDKAREINEKGSGIHQLSQSHPILGGIAKVADTIGGALLPGLTARIPGTEMHHNVVQHQADARVNADVQNDERLAQGNEANARADAIAHPKPKEPTTAFELWHQQNPQGTVEDWQKIQPDKAEAAINSPQAGYARAIADAIAGGRDPISDPHVMAWKQAIDDSAKTKEPNRDDRAIAIMSKPKEQWTPEEQAYMQGYKEFVDMNKVQPRVLGYAALGNTKLYPALDTGNGNAPTFVTPNAVNSGEPGRYAPAGPGATALSQENLIEDIKGASHQARQSVMNLRHDFDPATKLKLAVALRDSDPKSAISNLINNGALGNLTDDQQDFVIAIRQLTENAMAMRSVLKAGQGAEDMRSAIKAVLPGVLSPDKKFAIKQLDAFDNTLARVSRGVPKMPLREMEGGNNQEPTRPSNVPRGYVYNPNGPKGAGWYKPTVTH